MGNLIEAKKTMQGVAKRVKEMESRGDIEFPENYSPQNALKSAWLILQDTVDKNKSPVLENVTSASLANALLAMLIQGLNPDKKQCYFIAYGKKLACMRSYHGAIAFAKRINPRIKDIVAEVVWQGDEFEIEVKNGSRQVAKHKQTLESIDSKKPRAAYCLMLDRDENILACEVMTWEEIRSAWKKSIIKPLTDKGEVRSGTTHSEFMGEMIKRTVINRACKRVINTSDDSYLAKAARQSDDEALKAQIDEQVDENEGGVIDIGLDDFDEPVGAYEDSEVNNADESGAEQPDPDGGESDSAGEGQDLWGEDPEWD